jgi:hypothetical protein
MQGAASFLLPPTYREPVLGDLQERFSQRRASTRSLAYLVDVATTVPQVLRSQIRRTVTRGAACSTALSGDLRNRAEQLQTQVWLRNAVILVSLVPFMGAFLLNARGSWHFHESVSLAMTLGWIGPIWRVYGVRGRSTIVPASLSEIDLREFHRSEVIRQMDLGCRDFLYWSTPAALLIVYSLVVGVPGFRAGLFLLLALAMQNGAVYWTHGRERRRYQRELDRLEQEVAQA